MHIYMSYTILNNIFTYCHKYPAAPYRLQTSKICLGYRMGMAPDTWITRASKRAGCLEASPSPFSVTIPRVRCCNAGRCVRLLKNNPFTHAVNL
jgi:hypothetical protein